MVVQSERDINIPKLLNNIKVTLNRGGDDNFTVKVNKQLLIDCYDVIKNATNESEEDDKK